MKSSIAGRALAILQVAPAAALVLLAFTNPALASDDVLTTSCNTLLSIRRWLFTVVYILGACGLVIIAVTAFLGKFRFAHLISLGGGLFVVAMADALIGFLAADENGDNCTIEAI